MKRLLVIFGLLGAIGAWGGDPGKVSFERVARSDLDPYTNSPSKAMKRWFEIRFAQMVVYSPYFDNKTSWYRNAFLYFDLYGIHTDAPLARQHPSWFLHDSSGNRLYVPWGCSEGTCPQYAADIANPEYRAWWIRQARSALSKGYKGLWIDDVNMEFRVSDGNSRQIAPIDSTTGQVMSWDAWRNHVADFVEEVRKALPNTPIVHNSIWFAGPPGVRDRDPAIQRQIRAADQINVERGIAGDTGLTGGEGQWSLHDLFAYIDRVHSLGPSVAMQEYGLDASNQEYALAGYFLISSGRDLLGDINTTPANWWDGFQTDLGTPLGSRTYKNGVYQRKFSCGLVLLGEPGLAAQKIALDAPYTTLDGRSVRSVQISARQGVVLRSCRPGQAHDQE